MNKVGKKCFRQSRKIKQLHQHLRTTANLILKEEKENKNVGRKKKEGEEMEDGRKNISRICKKLIQN